MHTHLYKHTYKYIIYIYIRTYIDLNAHPSSNTPVLKKHIRCNIWTEKYVGLYLYDQFEFALLEANFSSDSDRLFFNFIKK